MDVFYTPRFKREFNKLPEALQNEANEKIGLFKKEPENHGLLKVHKLKGRLAGRLSFSVNYRYRIVFLFVDRKRSTAILLAVGDHAVYE